MHPRALGAVYRIRSLDDAIITDNSERTGDRLGPDFISLIAVGFSTKVAKKCFARVLCETDVWRNGRVRTMSVRTCTRIRVNNNNIVYVTPETAERIFSELRHFSCCGFNVEREITY